MRWLLIKDLQILKRSPLLVALLVVYPIVIALMIGFALSSPPGKPDGGAVRRGADRARGGEPRQPEDQHRALRQSAVPVDHPDPGQLTRRRRLPRCEAARPRRR